MIPSTVTALGAFLLLIAPGLLADILASKRQTGASETAFRELSRTVFFSLAFTLLAGILLATTLVIVTSLTWGGLNDFLVRSTMITSKSVTQSPPDLRFSWVKIFLLTSIIACLLAWIYHLIKFSKNDSYLTSVSAWYKVFYQDTHPDDNPKVDNNLKSKPYVRVRLSNNYTYMGTLIGYSEFLEAGGREIILGKPLRVTPPDGKITPAGARWERMVFKSDDIVSLAVRYDPVEYTPIDPANAVSTNSPESTVTPK